MSKSEPITGNSLHLRSTQHLPRAEQTDVSCTKVMGVVIAVLLAGGIAGCITHLCTDSIKFSILAGGCSSFITALFILCVLNKKSPRQQVVPPEPKRPTYLIHTGTPTPLPFLDFEEELPPIIKMPPFRSLPQQLQIEPAAATDLAPPQTEEILLKRENANPVIFPCKPLAATTHLTPGHDAARERLQLDKIKNWYCSDERAKYFVKNSIGETKRTPGGKAIHKEIDFPLNDQQYFNRIHEAVECFPEVISRLIASYCPRKSWCSLKILSVHETTHGKEIFELPFIVDFSETTAESVAPNGKTLRANIKDSKHATIANLDEKLQETIIVCTATVFVPQMEQPGSLSEFGQFVPELTFDSLLNGQYTEMSLDIHAMRFGNDPSVTNYRIGIHENGPISMPISGCGCAVTVSTGPYASANDGVGFLVSRLYDVATEKPKEPWKNKKGVAYLAAPNLPVVSGPKFSDQKATRLGLSNITLPFDKNHYTDRNFFKNTNSITITDAPVLIQINPIPVCATIINPSTSHRESVMVRNSIFLPEEYLNEADHLHTLFMQDLKKF